MRRVIILSLLVSLFWSCTSSTEQHLNTSDKILKAGIWRGVLKPQGIEIPFLFDIKKNEGGYKMVLINADEKLILDELVIEDDSLHVQLFVFDATIHAKIENDKLQGAWVKNYAEDYVIPFEATFGDDQRFEMGPQKMDTSFDGKWEVDFVNENGVEKAIGLFSQNGRKVTGTFLTTTGDYRFLEGIVDDDNMKLSCFDGSHAFLFEAEMQENGEITGEFWSGKTGFSKWTAKRNDDFELPDPYALTFLKEGYEHFDIKLPSTLGELVTLSDDLYKDKIVVVQILGTWCPNCMDETAFYADWYKKNKKRGVEIVGLAFESKANVEYATSRINKLKKKLGVEYEILIGGTPNDESIAEALPMLKELISFPTSIILDKQHKVRKIHTGFSGPGTGVYYEKFVEEFNLFMDKLIEE